LTCYLWTVNGVNENPLRTYVLGLGLAVALGGLMGCVSANPDLQSWVGHQVSELVASWGPAEQVVYVGDGNRMFVWSSIRTARGDASSYAASRAVWVSPGGEVYRWTGRGLDSKYGSRVGPAQANASTP
jgi:hypothetical protein